MMVPLVALGLRISTAHTILNSLSWENDGPIGPTDQYRT
jgi:hypothetical protein